MTKEEIVKARLLLDYGKNLMTLVDKMDNKYMIDFVEVTEDEHKETTATIEPELTKKIEACFDSMDDGSVLNNSYEEVKKYHLLTLNALDNYLQKLYTKKDNDTVFYIIKQLISVQDIVTSYEIDQFDTNTNLVSFDFRTYFNAITVFVTKTLCESLELLMHRVSSDPTLTIFIFEGIDFLKRIHVYTKTCKSGDDWDASLFDLEQLEGGNITLDMNLINKICKIHRRAYMIRYGNTYYKLVPGLVSVWKAS